MPNCQAIVKGTRIIGGGEISTPEERCLHQRYCIAGKRSPPRGEDTPDCQAIVKRYENNKVGRFQCRKRGVATSGNVLLGKAGFHPGERTTQAARPSEKGTRIHVIK